MNSRAVALLMALGVGSAATLAQQRQEQPAAQNQTAQTQTAQSGGAVRQQPAERQQESPPPRQGQTTAAGRPAAAPPTTPRRQAQSAAVVDVQELNNDIEDYLGQRVTVRGNVQEILGPSRFVVAGGELLNDEIAVVVPEHAQWVDPTLLRQDADVIVTGTVQQTQGGAIGGPMSGDLELDTDVDVVESESYIVAEQVTRGG